MPRTTAIHLLPKRLSLLMVALIGVAVIGLGASAVWAVNELTAEAPAATTPTPSRSPQNSLKVEGSGSVAPSTSGNTLQGAMPVGQSSDVSNTLQHPTSNRSLQPNAGRDSFHNTE